MGEHHVGAHKDEESHRAFVRALLDDVRALDRMLREGLIESGVRRIGVEQEYFLVDRAGHASMRGPEILDSLDDPAFTTEIARFNLEANLDPQIWGGSCLRNLESDLDSKLQTLRAAAHEFGADALLTGILPTLQLSDASLESMTPAERYRALNDAAVAQRGGSIPVRIKGIDEFFTVTDNVMLEACNTSLQVHFQTGPDEFARLYNLSQAVTPLLLAGAVNSPVLMGHRLWAETRVALFQRSVDERTVQQLERGKLPRVRFGERWIDESVLEIFREDIARFRVMLATDVGEDPLAMLDRGELPPLRALCLHNGTVWRWNRACYGVHQGVAHLRIENRVLPAGPTVLDEVANAAFFYGLLVALGDEFDDIRQAMPFEAVKTNFMAAARRGLRAQFTWLNNQSHTAADLILEELVPRARSGLESSGIDANDIDRYLGVYEERVRSRQTGSEWMMLSLAGMGDRGWPHERHRALTLAALRRQGEGRPVHEWGLAEFEESDDWRHGYQTVGLFMTRDLFTVRPDDVVDLAANLMEWKHIRHVPVEDESGTLVGLVTHRDLVRLLAEGALGRGGPSVPVRSIMRDEVVSVTPETPTLDALDIMKRRGFGCLPVLHGGRLVGIVTERDFLEVASGLLEFQLRRLSRLAD